MGSRTIVSVQFIYTSAMNGFYSTSHYGVLHNILVVILPVLNLHHVSQPCAGNSSPQAACFSPQVFYDLFFQMAWACQDSSTPRM